jgi:hypothetical protein
VSAVLQQSVMFLNFVEANADACTESGRASPLCFGCQGRAPRAGRGSGWTIGVLLLAVSYAITPQ